MPKQRQRQYPNETKRSKIEITQLTPDGPKGVGMDNKVLTPTKRRPPAAGMGRIKGVPNKTTQNVREMIAMVAEENAPKFAEWLNTVAMGDGDKVKPDPAKAAGIASLAQATREKTEAPLTIADRTRLNELIRDFGTDEGARRFRAERDEAERKKAAAGAPPQTPTEKATLPGKATQLGKVEEAALQGAKTIETANSIDRVLDTAFTACGATYIVIHPPFPSL